MQQRVIMATGYIEFTPDGHVWIVVVDGGLNVNRVWLRPGDTISLENEQSGKITRLKLLEEGENG